MLPTPIELYLSKHRPNSSFDQYQQNVFQKMILLQKMTEIEEEKKEEKKYMGIYIYGDVGRGKTMMARIYLNSSTLMKKLQINFHTFIQLIKDESCKKYKRYRNLKEIINKIIPDVKLLLLDEFYLTDSKIDKFLFKILNTIIEQGIVLLITSNVPPEQLSSQRIVDFIKKNIISCVLQGEKDYRSTFNAHNKTSYYLSSNTSLKKISNIFNALIKNKQYRKDNTISRGKKITAYKYCNGIAWFFFKQLCTRNLNEIDYDLLAKKYKTIFLINIPILSAKEQDQIKRLSVLIDKLYEHRTRVIFLADEQPEKLCQDPELEASFKRTVSRINAMTTRKYLFTRYDNNKNKITN